ncbi:unnamed protein product [Gongylonema pulchrum]|uniref:Uncharacterized protein n=1 Tax=Gongylonema pulchrum TaxID=637853 RepID=A0A3P7QF98_9BILA|nr:unnamed protein product [Gongylonema pulchrum]
MQAPAGMTTQPSGATASRGEIHTSAPSKEAQTGKTNQPATATSLNIRTKKEKETGEQESDTDLTSSEMETMKSIESDAHVSEDQCTDLRSDDSSCQESSRVMDSEPDTSEISQISSTGPKKRFKRRSSKSIESVDIEYQSERPVREVYATKSIESGDLEYHSELFPDLAQPAEDTTRDRKSCKSREVDKSSSTASAGVCSESLVISSRSPHFAEKTLKKISWEPAKIEEWTEYTPEPGRPIQDEQRAPLIKTSTESSNLEYQSSRHSVEKQSEDESESENSISESRKVQGTAHSIDISPTGKSSELSDSSKVSYFVEPPYLCGSREKSRLATTTRLQPREVRSNDIFKRGFFISFLSRANH